MEEGVQCMDWICNIDFTILSRCMQRQWDIQTTYGINMIQCVCKVQV